MQTNEHILFRETSDNAAEFLHELGDPNLVRNRALSTGVSAALRTQQVERLRRNIVELRSRQADFNTKMDDYVSNLKRLIQSLGQMSHGNGDAVEECRKTRVHCLACRRETTFDLEVLFARESEESLSLPTECYVSEMGKLKKGVFHCSRCGGEALRICPS